MIRLTLLFFLYFSLRSHCVAAAELNQSWRVSRIEITRTKATMTSDHLLHLTVTEAISNHSLTLISPTFISSVKSTQTLGTNLLVIGFGNEIEEALVFDLRHPEAQNTDRAIGYGFHLLDGHWLTWVEWYPNHVFPPQYPTDVLLARDLLNHPIHNQVNNSSDDLSPLIHDSSHRAYPDKPAGSDSYGNVLNSNKAIVKIFPSTLTGFSHATAVFLTSTGPDGQQNEQKLAEVDLAAPEGHAKLYSLRAAYEAAGIQPGTYLEVDHLEVAGPRQVRIVFTSRTYSNKFAIINLSK